MTEAEAKTLKVGDRVLVAMTVSALDAEDSKAPVELEGCGDKFWPHVSLLHSVLPRPLEVGDRVTTGESSPIVIISLDGNFAWCRWEANEGPDSQRMTLLVDNLARIS